MGGGILCAARGGGWIWGCDGEGGTESGCWCIAGLTFAVNGPGWLLLERRCQTQ